MSMDAAVHSWESDDGVGKAALFGICVVSLRRDYSEVNLLWPFKAIKGGRLEGDSARRDTRFPGFVISRTTVTRALLDIES